MEYIKAVFKNTPYQLKISVYPWSRAVKYTQSGETLALLGPAKEEAPDLIFPQSEIGQQNFCFFTQRGDPWLYTEPNSIMGRVISVPQDTFPSELNKFRHKAQFLIKPYNKDYVAVVLGMLALKRINTILLTYNSMMDHLNNNPKLVSQIKFANCASKQNLYLAFTPIIEKREKVKEVIAVFEREIALLRKQHFLERLLMKYQLN